MDQSDIIITEEDQGQRLDKVLAQLCVDLSRSRLQALIAEGCVTVGSVPQLSVKYKVKLDDHIVVDIPDALDAAPMPQNIPLDIRYEDDDLLVINKPVGLVVHPGAGNHDGTLVNALLHHCGDSLSGIGGVKRPGIVHRLDKDTSGLMLVAKNDGAHQSLSSQLQARDIKRTYHALCWGVPERSVGIINQPLGRDRKDRLRMAVIRGGTGGRDAVTRYKVLESFGDDDAEHYGVSLVECRLETGRTHQIRVHMQFIGMCLIGDMMYGAPLSQQKAMLNKGHIAEYLPENGQIFYKFPRQALHAAELVFRHPVTDEEMRFQSDYPDDLANLVQMLRMT